MSTATIEAPPALSSKMQAIARDYLEARKRAGAALLDQARYLAEARAAAKHGEWGVFLAATQTSDDWAERLLDIHDQAERSPQFAEAIRTNFLSATVAGLLARESTPPAIVDQVLSASERPTSRQVEQEIRESKIRSAADFETAPFWQSMSPNHPTAHLWTRVGMNEHRAACGMTAQRAPNGSTEAGHCSSCVRATWKEQPAEPELPPDFAGVQARLAALGVTLTSDVRGGKRWYTTSRPGKVGITTPTWSNVVDSLEYHERKNAAAAPLDPAIDAGAGVGAILEPPAEAASAAAAPAPPAHTKVCVRCGKGRDLHRHLTSYQAGLVPEYGGKSVTLCSTCIPLLLKERADVKQLDNDLPADLEKAGYFWKQAAPPIISHYDGWTGDAPTVASCLQLARDHLRKRAENEPRARAAELLRQLAPLLAAITPADQETLSLAISNLNECEEGSEAQYFLAVGWALIGVMP